MAKEIVPGHEEFTLNEDGSITVPGKVDGRDIATDGTKLDGIEAAATADQTKAEIDALGLSHDSLVDVSSDDHHAQSHDHSAAGDGQTLTPATLNIPSSATPAQTTEGQAVWDSDGDFLTIGDGTSRKSLMNVGDAPTAHKDSHDPEDGSDPLDTAAPVKVGSANAVGTSHAFSKADHVHEREHTKTADNEVYGLLLADTIANQPAASIAGRLFWSTDEHILYRDTGAAWVKIAAADHADLDGIGASDHHAKYTDAEAVTAAKTVKLDDFTAPDDNTDLDFSISAHGLVPKGTNVGNFLKDDGTWAAPSAAAHDLGGASHNADTLANLNSKVSDDTLLGQGTILSLIIALGG